MTFEPRRYGSFIVGAGVVLTLTVLVSRYRYELQVQRGTADALVLLHALGDGVNAQFEGGMQALRTEPEVARPGTDMSQGGRRPARIVSPWHPWRMVGSAYSSLDGRAPQIAVQTLLRDLAGRAGVGPAALLLGPYGTESGDNAVALVIREKIAGAAPQWRGESILIGELLPAASTARFLEQGFRIQLIDAVSGSVFYQSDDGVFEAPVVGALAFAPAGLQLRAAPRAGWHLPMRAWAGFLLLLLVVLASLGHELRRGNRFRDAVDELAAAEQRRKQLNALYGKAIESVAALESRLQVVSMYDTVTGLANRLSLLRRIETGLEAMRQSPGAPLGLLSIGFDHLQHIANSFGTEFASRVLVVAAERVEFVLPSKDLLYRIGDADLAVVLPNAEPGASVNLAAKIVAEIEAPISMDSHTFMLHPSVGIAETSSGYQYVEALLDQANTALSAAQRDTATRYCVFDSTTAKESVSRLQLEVDLIRAFEENQFVLEYEPIITPVTNIVAGFEGLIRWNHPTEGRIGPNRFVPIAVQAGLSHRLNTWVMRESVRQASLWQRAGYKNLSVHFNLSAEAFLKSNLEADIGELLAEFELDGSCLSVELTESTLIQDLRGAARTLQKLTELDIGAWLDDFGTGYSSLSYLRELPLKGVKIDRSFVERTVVNARDFGFLKSLIDLVSYLGMQSIAEGIETREQYELLSLTTCDLYQGHHFAPSMSAAQAERWMNDAGGVRRREMRA